VRLESEHFATFVPADPPRAGALAVFLCSGSDWVLNGPPSLEPDALVAAVPR
jgi:hypothetical protein